MSGDAGSAVEDPNRGGWLKACEHLLVEHPEDLRHWLAEHGSRPEGLWIVTWKEGAGRPCVSRWAVLDELLCAGWIDGARRQVDTERTAQWVSPRRHARWTAAYRMRVERLRSEGRLQPPGLAAIAEAQRAGTWMALEEVDRLVIPDDLRLALLADADAADWLARQAPSYRRNLLRWLALAKTPSTRGRRLQAIALSAQSRRRLAHF